MRPNDVHDSLRAHVLVDGYDMVLDTAASQGSWLVDARTGDRYLDVFTFYASSPLGMNHPDLLEDEDFRATLLEVAMNKPANSDVYTVEMARFVDTLARVLGDDALPHYFFIEGGAAAVENALKVAFDWKSRHNAMHGRAAAGSQVMHLKGAFHGRSGYTMSLTNTDPAKVAKFPKFDWPRLTTPIVRHPLADHADDLARQEAIALAEARDAFARYPHDIACIIAEPIQGEGGDNHLRPEFLRALQDIAHANDALFVLDEVQTGAVITGHAWAHQGMGLEPDVIAFGKKLQVCGVMAGRRVDEVPDNVFNVSSRINSTWGGNLTDMVRARRILEVVESRDLITNAKVQGEHLLGRLLDLAERHPDLVSNVRGRGLLCAVDMPDGDTRDRVTTRLMAEEKVMMLGCGTHTLRFRPSLAVTAEELDTAVDALDRVLSTVR
ncbi:putative L-lysine-epsilon aminotransferase [Euzebya pacifica]|uniref:L-lysine-epsilon aminotransferase n=1 Tax=Euzebya pacifica TaxID=1608957 RepID=A0A346XZ75_9ACTN|nr:L-lysine 6-transaminase [Euzebya pacifica]AXV07522.1 putative L-lysine-epsilon aminotransferase [Euzebya pacifica]